MFVYFYDSLIGKLGFVEANEKIVKILFEKDKFEDIEIMETALIKEAYLQIDLYLQGKLKEFTFCYQLPSGTKFANKVLEALLSIPYGKTTSYQKIANQCGNPKASRAVGNINHKNPLPFLFPCHRIIGANGKLSGYRGGLKAKQYLLELEQKNQ